MRQNISARKKVFYDIQSRMEARIREWLHLMRCFIAQQSRAVKNISRTASQDSLRNQGIDLLLKTVTACVLLSAHSFDDGSQADARQNL